MRTKNLKKPGAAQPAAPSLEELIETLAELNEEKVGEIMVEAVPRVKSVYGELRSIGDNGVARPIDIGETTKLMVATLKYLGIPAEKRRSYGNMNRAKAAARYWALFAPVDDALLDLPGAVCTPKGPIFLNGTVPGAVFTGCTRVDPASGHAAWDEVMLEWMSGEQGHADWLQVAYGAALFGYGQELRHVLVNVGNGFNGKSVFHRVLHDVLGPLAGTVSIDTICSPTLAKDGSAHKADVAAMFGRRLITTCETDSGFRIDAKGIKTMAGGLDPLVARRPYAVEPISFLPTFLLVMSTNYLPSMPGHDGALWDRLVLINWKQRYPNDPVVTARIRALAPECLAWLIDGARKYVTNQRQLPAKPAEWTATINEARVDADPLGEWITDNLMPQVGTYESLSLHQIAFMVKLDFAGVNDDPPKSSALTYALKRAGYKCQHTRNGNVWNCMWRPGRKTN